VDIKKLALLFAFAFVITGIVVYQVRATRNKTSAATTTGMNPTAPVTAAPVAAAPAVSPVSIPPVSIQQVQGEAPRAAVELPALSIPPSGWGRSPFLTVEEIAKLNEPAAPPSVIETIEPPKPVVETLPVYVFHGIFNDKTRGIVTVVLNEKPYRVGDRIGKELVKQIKEDSVILESGGKTRELSRKTNPGG
jgi:hypothetical protein